MTSDAVTKAITTMTDQNPATILVCDPAASGVALPVCLYPWFENPYGLVSWWDMRQFAGDHLHSALAILGKIECDMVHYRAPGDPGAAIFMGSVVVPVDERGKIEEALRFVESAFKAIGLHTTPVAVCELRTTLIN